MESRERAFAYKDLFSRRYRTSLLIALLMLAASYVAAHFAYAYAIEYATRPTTTYVGDLLLDNLPVINLNWLIIEGALLALVASLAYLLAHPRSILFSLKALALFIMTRAIFMSLTHVGVYPDHINPGIGLFDALYVYLNLQSGFFFSGHTGLPFLGAMVFWEHRTARIAFLLLSVIFAAAMLLARVHYSIDVLAAPFMAYGVFALTRRLFPKDYALGGREFGAG